MDREVLCNHPSYYEMYEARTQSVLLPDASAQERGWSSSHVMTTSIGYQPELTILLRCWHGPIDQV